MTWKRSTVRASACPAEAESVRCPRARAAPPRPRRQTLCFQTLCLFPRSPLPLHLLSPPFLVSSHPPSFLFFFCFLLLRLSMCIFLIIIVAFPSTHMLPCAISLHMAVLLDISFCPLFPGKPISSLAECFPMSVLQSFPQHLHAEQITPFISITALLCVIICGNSQCSRFLSHCILEDSPRSFACISSGEGI